MELNAKHLMGFLLIAVLLCGTPAAWAQEETTGDGDRVTEDVVTAVDSDSMFVADEGPVAVPEASEKAMRYYRSGNVLWVVETLWGWIVPLILLFSGLSAWFEKIGRRYGKKWYFAFVIYILLFSLVDALLSFPLSWYSDFIRQHAYDLSNQSFGAWFGEMLKESLIGVVIVLMFLWIPLKLIRRFPRTWWVWFSAGSVPFIILIIMVSPIWIQPMFDDFGPMKDKELEQKILSLADRAGIEGSHVFEVNKSEDTKTVNAYVTGFGGTKRIVLWDTIIEKMNNREILFVMGHEMGHYVLGHMYMFVVLMVLLMLIGFYTVHRTSGWILRKWGDRFGFKQLSDIAAIPLILLLFSLVLFVLSPFVNGFSRSIETTSDKFGLELTRDNHAAATAFIKLQESNLANPRPGLLYKLWRSDHPPIAERIELMNSYKPWETGQPLKFAKYVTPPPGQE